MTHVIRQQPNGEWCVFSTVVDDFIIEDAERGQIIYYYMMKEREKVTERLDEIESGDRVVRHPTLQTYQDLCDRREMKHGTDQEDGE